MATSLQWRLAMNEVRTAASKNRVMVAVALALVTLGTDALISQQSAPPGNRRTTWLDGREVVEGEVIVRYVQQAGRIERERAEFQAYSDTSEGIGRLGSRRVRSRRLTTRQMLESLRANPDVEYVEPNYIIRANATANDPMMNSLWGLLNTGQVVDGQAGVPGADIAATSAWDLTTGSRATVVAVLDSGIDFTHPDLSANMFRASRQFSVTIGTITVTCVAGTHGFNALNNSCVPIDDNGHGTHVAGIIGAVGNNSIGVTGVNWTTSLMALKVLGADGTGTTADAIKAINWAIKAKAELGADADVRVLNASWGGGIYSQALDDEIAAANNANMLFVAAAGTDGTDNDLEPHYPASSISPNVISVAATDNTGELAPYSNFGASSVDIAAPGGSTLSTLPDGGYGELGGTSMSAAFVSGAAALVLSGCPSLSTAALKSGLLDSVDTRPSLTGKTTSGGRLNAASAVSGCVPTPTLAISDISVAEGNSGTSNASFTVTLSPLNSSQTVTVDYTTASGSATSGSDFTAASGTLTFAPGASTRTIVVPVHGDAETEPNETFTVTLANATHAQIGDAQAVGTITNDDVPSGPAVNVASTSVTPGGVINFTVTGGPGNASDWVGLFTTAAGDSGHLVWKYLSGSTTHQFTAPAQPGTYNIRLFANGTYTKLATSATVTVATTPPSPTLSIGDVTIAEGNSGASVATFTVTLSPVNTSQTVTVNYATANGSATAGSDYVAASGTITFSPSTATRTINVTVSGDTSSEPAETFLVQLSGAANAAIGDGQATGTITNDDVPPGPAVNVASTSVTPGAVINFTVTGGPGNATDWVGLYSTASADTGYIVWKYVGGSTTHQFTAPTQTGTYNIRLFANNGYTKLATSATITVATTPPPPPSPTLTIGDVSVAEGNSGTSVATFTVTLSPVNSSQSVSVNYATANGSATGGSDYAPASGTLTFPPSSATQTISVTVTGDTASEPAETFTVTLSGAVNAAIGDGQATGTITNDDVPPGPAVNVASTTVQPGAVINFTITGAPNNPSDWVGLYTTAAGDSGHLVWKYLSGATSSQFTAPTQPGYYNVRLFASGTYSKLATSETISIGVAPPSPTLTIGDVSVTEGNSGTSVATFTVTLSPVNSSASVTVNYATADGSASGGSDYAPASGMLTFPPSTATQTISVTVTGDATVEPTETFLVTLSGAVNAGIGDAQATGTITNDDVPPGPAGPAVNVASTTVAPGAVISFTITGAPNNPSDWVGLYTAASNDSGHIVWKYLSGATASSFTAPTQPGSYNVRLFASGSYSKLATSATITVTSQ
jgi:subtilisin family serine protease/ribosomal protein L35AE/L33A